MNEEIKKVPIFSLDEIAELARIAKEKSNQYGKRFACWVYSNEVTIPKRNRIFIFASLLRAQRIRQKFAFKMH
jgi:hypothetical protein